MKSLNKVLLIGYTATDPEVKVVKNDIKVAKFTIATNKTDENKNQITDFHKVVAWRHLADIVESYVKKGKGLYIEGFLQNSSWENKKGEKQYSTEIVLDDLNLLTYDKK
jgi:single-strand DNA-binding protein